MYMYIIIPKNLNEQRLLFTRLFFSYVARSLLKIINLKFAALHVSFVCMRLNINTLFY